MPKQIDITGKVFGRLTVIRQNGRDAHGGILWLCQCSCGNDKSIYSSSLRSGATQSCGCLLKEAVSRRSRTHGKSTSKTCRIWYSMKQRCFNPNDPNYDHYGGRGIKICQRWLNDFQNFLDDMGECPKGYSIERKDVDGDYDPDNCVWLLKIKQAQNKTTTHWAEINGEKMCLTELTRRANISREKLRYWMEEKNLPLQEALEKTKTDNTKKLTWDIEKASQMLKQGYSYKKIAEAMGINIASIFYAFERHNIVQEKKNSPNSIKRWVEYHGETILFNKLARRLGISRDKLRYRMDDKGMSLEQALADLGLS